MANSDQGTGAAARGAFPDATGSRLKPHLLAIGLIVALLAFVSIAAGFLFWKSFEDTKAGARSQAISASQVVAANIGWAVETARQVLRRVDDAFGNDLSTPPADAARKLSDAISTLPGSVKVYLVAADGTTQLTTDPDFKPINITDREYFSALASGDLWHISSLLVSRLNGDQIFAISKRIERDGAFAGAAILSFDSTLLGGVWQSLNLDQQSTVGLVRDDGQLVSRFPLPDGPLDLSQYVLFTDYLPKSDFGTYDAISPADGVSRIVAYRRVPGTNLVALASLSTQGAFASFNAAAASVLWLAIPALLALILTAYWTFGRLLRDARRSERESQFLIFAEAMPNHVWTAQPNGLLDWFNSRVLEYSGDASETLVGQGWTKLVHPDDLGQAAAAWDLARSRELPYETEFRLRRRDGVYRWHIARAVPIRDAEGHLVRWIGTNTDIEEQKRVAQALRESESRLRLAIEGGHLAVWEVDIANRRITPSAALNHLYGFPAEATPTIEDYQSRYAPGERARVEELAAEATARGESELEVEVRSIWPDGTEKWLLIRAQTAPEGATGRIIGVVIDITERKRVEQALRDSERRFRLSQHAAGIASLELDIASGEVIGSEHFWEIWGLSQRESVHISVLESIVIPDDGHIRSNQQTREAGTAAPAVEYRIRRPDNGQLRWLARTVEFIHDENGKPIKMFGIMQDVTDRKEAETRQVMLTNELEHRIKNILAMVSAIASQTLRNVDLDMARDAFNERLRALATAHDILTKTRWTEASLSEVIKATVAPLPNERILVDGPAIALNPKMALSLALAVNELATNALKYGALSNETGHIEIKWSLGAAPDGVQTLTWRWREIGGPPVSMPTRKGFGTFLIGRVLAADFGGVVGIEYLAGGVECTLTAAYPWSPIPTTA